MVIIKLHNKRDLKTFKQTRKHYQTTKVAKKGEVIKEMGPYTVTSWQGLRRVPCMPLAACLHACLLAMGASTSSPYFARHPLQGLSPWWWAAPRPGRAATPPLTTSQNVNTAHPPHVSGCWEGLSHLMTSGDAALPSCCLAASILRWWARGARRALRKHEGKNADLPPYLRPLRRPRLNTCTNPFLLECFCFFFCAHDDTKILRYFE